MSRVCSGCGRTIDLESRSQRHTLPKVDIDFHAKSQGFFGHDSYDNGYESPSANHMATPESTSSRSEASGNFDGQAL